jgi:hypothetical protein
MEDGRRQRRPSARAHRSRRENILAWGCARDLRPDESTPTGLLRVVLPKNAPTSFSKLPFSGDWLIEQATIGAAEVARRRPRLKNAVGELHVSINTISFHMRQFHMRQVYERLQIHSKSEAFTKALRQRLIR